MYLVCKNLTTLDVFTCYTTKKSTDVVSSFCIVKKFTEHFYTSYSCSFWFFNETDDFNNVTNFNYSTLNTSSSNCTTTSD